ncbi:Hypothetical protein GLP15_1788 [Giardia lamblia P15]|uniref:Vacuolar import/degradation Vid27 C-terminal domain-containing protein n=1 Tax=Giardia intestinalis (strain P15) TaxID=658858 RepID=E1F393_GIAIA|nr:Hypothetical protein GLP15_1788 [Giardia lamblia P15]
MIRLNGYASLFLPSSHAISRPSEESCAHVSLCTIPVYTVLSISLEQNLHNELNLRTISLTFKDLEDSQLDANTYELSLFFRLDHLTLSCALTYTLCLRLSSVISCEIECGSSLTDTEVLSYIHKRATQLLSDSRKPFILQGIRTNSILKCINISKSYKARVAYPFSDKRIMRLGTVGKMAFLDVDEIKHVIGNANFTDLLDNASHGARMYLFIIIKDTGRFLVPLSSITAFSFFHRDRELTLLLPVRPKGKRHTSMEPIVLVFKKLSTFVEFEERFCASISAPSPHNLHPFASTPRATFEETVIHQYITKSSDTVVGSSYTLSPLGCLETKFPNSVYTTHRSILSSRAGSESDRFLTLKSEIGHTYNVDHSFSCSDIIFRANRSAPRSRNVCFTESGAYVAATMGRYLDLLCLRNTNDKNSEKFSVTTCKLGASLFVPSKICFDHNFSSSGLIFVSNERNKSKIDSSVLSSMFSSVLDVDSVILQEGMEHSVLGDYTECSNSHDLYGFDVATGRVSEHILLYNVAADRFLSPTDFCICKEDSIPPTVVGCNIPPSNAIIAVTQSSIHLIDRRLSGKTHLTGHSYTYKAVANLSVGCLSDKGNLVVATDTGDISFFHTMARAATSFGGFGLPIIGLCLTTDEDWLVATMPTMIAVYYLRGETSSVFKHNGLRLSERQQPRLLRLTQDLITVLLSATTQRPTSLQFSPARLSPNEDLLIASVGEYAILWDFKEVCLGVTDYSNAIITRTSGEVLGACLVARGAVEGIEDKKESCPYLVTATTSTIDVLNCRFPHTP